MGFIGVVALVASAAGTVMQAKAQNQAAKAEAARLKFNARVKENEAKNKRRALLEEQHIRRGQARRDLESTRAKLMGQGTTMSGSSLTVLLQATEDMAADIAAVSTEREAGIRALSNSAAADRMSAKNARKAGKLSVASTLVGGVGKGASMGFQLGR